MSDEELSALLQTLTVVPTSSENGEIITFQDKPARRLRWTALSIEWLVNFQRLLFLIFIGVAVGAITVSFFASSLWAVVVLGFGAFAGVVSIE